MSGRELLTAALGYVDEHGWYVLPLHDITRGHCSCTKRDACPTSGKHPRFKKWQEWATLDRGVVTGWWKQWPTANIGILTGPKSGIVVLDVDPRHGGFETLAKLLPLPEGPVVKTGGGGKHFYFAHPGETVKGFVVGDGVELKADGQFVVAPPSLTGEVP